MVGRFQVMALLQAARAKDLFEGVDLTQIEPGSLSEYVFTAPSTQDDEASYRTWEGMKRLGMISP